MTATSRTPHQRAGQVMAFLRRHKEDRGALAQLRAARSPVQRCRAWPLLAEVDGIGDTVAETVAALYAMHPEEADKGNMGTVCATLSADHSTFEGRFKRILSCGDRDELCEHLRPLVMAAKPKGIPVNFFQLLVDISYWGDRVRVEWAKEFWRSPCPASPQDAPARNGQP